MSKPSVLWVVSASYHLHDLSTVLISSGEIGRVDDKIGLNRGRVASFGEPYEEFAAPHVTEGMIHEPVVQYAVSLPEDWKDEMKTDLS